jgi:hypothetical protein
MLKRYKSILLLICILVGAEYFTTFSQLDIYAPLQGMAALLPLQIGVLIYFFVTGKLTPSKKVRE